MSVDLKRQPNEKRCTVTEITHSLTIPPCCPISKNPLAGSRLQISYLPLDYIIEVASLRAYVDSYQGGRGDVRSMEGMIQAICQDAANCVMVSVRCFGFLKLSPEQDETVSCYADPK